MDTNADSAENVTPNPSDSDHANSENEGTVPGAVEDFLSMELPPETETTLYLDSDLEESSGFEATESDAHSEYNAESVRGLKDDKGVGFDPTLHIYPPEKTPSGRWKKIPKSKREKMVKEDGAEVEPNEAIRLNAQKAAQLYALAHTIPFGQNGLPETSADLNILTDSFERYLVETGNVDIPPHLDALLSMGIYTQGIATRPTNMKRISNWFARVKAKLAKKKETSKSGLKAAQEKIRKSAEAKEQTTV